MKLLKMLSMATLFLFGASYAHACAVDAVSGKTDTTITISWDLSACKQVNSGEKFEICWKESGDFGAACKSPNIIRKDTKTGTATIEGLSPSIAYKIKTQWHRKQSWYDVTTRIVTTNPGPTRGAHVLRYEKESQERYKVYFFWKNPPTPNPGSELILWIRAKGAFVAPMYRDVKEATYNSSTREYSLTAHNLSNNSRYVACIANFNKKKRDLTCVSNSVEWK